MARKNNGRRYLAAFQPAAVLLPLVAKFRRAYAQVLFHKTTQIGHRRKIHAVGNLAQRQFRLRQKARKLLNDKQLNPITCTSSADALAQLRKVVRRDEKTPGVMLQRAILHIVPLNQHADKLSINSIGREASCDLSFALACISYKSNT